MLLYCIENLRNGKRYIGFTTQPLEERFREHKLPCMRNKYRKHYPLYAAMNKYGTESFICYEIYSGPDALEMEDHYIQLMGDYNVARGGSVPPNPKGKPRSVEHCQNLSKALRGIPRKKRDQTGAKNTMFGKAPWNKGKRKGI
jgi:group I intron endonuclease